jgi:putative transposase
MKNHMRSLDQNYNVKILSRISEIHQYKSLAEMLQIKYPKIWKENKNIKKKNFNHIKLKILLGFC